MYIGGFGGPKPLMYIWKKQSKIMLELLVRKRSTCSVWRCRLPSRTVFFPHFCSAQNKRVGGCRLLCVHPHSIVVIDAALLLLYGINFFVYAHSLGCHRTHFPVPHSFFYISFYLPIHIWFMSVGCCLWPTIIPLPLLLPPPLFRFPCLPRFHRSRFRCWRRVPKQYQ